MPREQRAADIRRALYELLEQGPIGERRTRFLSRIIIALIVVNLVAAALETVPSFERAYGSEFSAIEWISLVIFSAEYLARLWCASEHAPARHLSATRARLQFALSAAGLVDLLAVLPFWLGIFLHLDLRFLLVFRIVRFLKLARYSPAMRSLIEALNAERRALFGCVVILTGTTLVAASLMYLAERHVQPDKLGTVPDAMWWAIVTLGTIGYGDVVPVTPLGKMVAAVTIFFSLVMIALPVGIIATAFSEQIHRRDFVVTWGMVAKVPLFSELEAGDIADIMQLLRAQTVEPGAVVVRRGDPARSMYFIAAGEVEVELRDRTVRLGVGHFFGEVAVLRRARRSATVTALTRVNLLVLDGGDLHALMEREPRVAARMREMIREKLGREVVGAHGDIVTEELEEGEREREG
ncbi:MAG TPA: cyclic nucleotide-gated ion channel [Xanthobacteraceae bacterium]|nr:cyclic nucleotide-gated ion channel [Xanthobacteraceae bacterium]